MVERKPAQKGSVTCPKSHSSQATELENSGQGTPKPLFFPQPPLVAQGSRNMGRWGQGSLLSCPWLWSQGLWPLQEFSPAAGPLADLSRHLPVCSELFVGKAPKKKKKVNSPAKLKCSPWRGRKIKFDEPLHNVQVMNV